MYKFGCNIKEMLSIDLVAISFYPQRVLLNFGKTSEVFYVYL